MFALDVVIGPAQTVVHRYDMFRYLAQLVVGERRQIELLAAVHGLGRTPQIGDVAAELARRQISHGHDRQRHAGHEAEKIAVGAQHFAQRHVVGQCRTDDPLARAHGRIEVAQIGALRPSLDRIAPARGYGLGDLLAQEVVRHIGTRSRIVDHPARDVDNGKTQPLHVVAVSEIERLGRLARFERVAQTHVQQLQLSVEPVGLIGLFARILERDETDGSGRENHYHEQKQPPAVRESNPRSHSRNRCVL